MATRHARIKLRRLGIVVALACAVTPVFNLLTNPRRLEAVLQGVVDALFVALAVGGYLLFVRDGLLRAWLRRWNFVANLIFNAIVLLALFLVARSLAQVVTTGRLARSYQSLGDPHLMYALPFFAACAFAVLFVLQMNRMVGTNVLGYFLAGVYHRPVNEQRIFMFLDLEGSTQLAERLGSSAYYALLRRFVDDLTVPIVETAGEIYQYAGDEVVITWRQDEGLRDANCVRCFFAICTAIERNARSYQRDFGTVPRFRAGLHGGAVIAGELGDLKQQIVFVGDILNTAARLEEYAKTRRLQLVASAAVVERLELPAGVAALKLDQLHLRGKESAIVVYSLTGGVPQVSDQPDAAAGGAAAVPTGRTLGA